MLQIRQIPGLRWTAVYTKARCEKVVADYCERHGFAYYLPLRRRAQRYQRRTVETFLPMFPSYTFVQISETDKTLLAQSHKTVAILPVDDAQEARLIEELQDIRILERAQLELEVEVLPELAPGRTVRITSGPLSGLNGIVERRQQQTRVTVNVEMLGQSVSVEVDLGEVDVAEK